MKFRAHPDIRTGVQSTEISTCKIKLFYGDLAVSFRSFWLRWFSFLRSGVRAGAEKPHLQ